MSPIVEQQIRDFARVYVESLPEVDIDKIRNGHGYAASSKMGQQPKPRSVMGRVAARGPMIAVTAGVVVLVLGLAPILFLATGRTPSDRGTVPDPPTGSPEYQDGEQTVIPDESTSNGGTGDPDGPPSETINGPRSKSLAGQVLAAIPELAAFAPPTLKDFSEGGVDGAIVTFQAPDGAYVDVVSQQLPEPLAQDLIESELIRSPEDTSTELGPNGEQIFIKEDDWTLQVIGVDAGNSMVNIIVNRTTSEIPQEASPYTDWSVDSVRSWVIHLLEQR